MDLIVIVTGIVFLIKRNRLKNTIHTAYPGVSQETFEKWKKLELRRFSVFLKIVGIWIGYEFLILVPLYVSSQNEGLLGMCWLALPVLIIAFAVSSKYRNEARIIRMSFNNQ
ncbi:hypothetical protein JW948_09255 [bacterium]|nr:hypothetical protein [bacterium]